MKLYNLQIAFSANRPVRSMRGAVKNKTPAKKSSVRQNHESEKESNEDAVVELTAIQKAANMEADNETVWCSKSKFINHFLTIYIITRILFKHICVYFS